MWATDDNRDGPMLDHGYTISSPGEPLAQVSLKYIPVSINMGGINMSGRH